MRCGSVRGRVAALLAMVALGTWAGSASAETSVFAWGRNIRGELGPGFDGSLSSEPWRVGETGGGIVSLAAGPGMVYALEHDGSVEAWGEGPFGNGRETADTGPVPVPQLSGVTQIAVGRAFGLALRSDGTVEAWGNNEDGQLGKPAGSTVVLSPEPVAGLEHVVAIAAGLEASYALLADGTVRAWGSNYEGSLGAGNESEFSSTPEVVSGLSEAVAIAAGGYFAEALLKNGEVRTWGRGANGRLGDDSEISSDVPVAVTGLSHVAAISAGEAFSLALLEGGTVESWGSDSWDQLGYTPYEGGVGGNTKVPHPVLGLTGVKAVAASGLHSLALLEDGTLMAWGGDEYGEVGDGRSGHELSVANPVAVSCSLTNVSAIATTEWVQFALAPAEDQTCPWLGSISPTEGAAAGGTPVRIEGGEFDDVEAVLFGSQEASSFHVESPNVLVAVAPPGTANLGVNLRVVTATGTTVVPSKGDLFTPRDAPTVTGIEPAYGLAGGGAHVVVTGTQFFSPTVSFGGVPAEGVKYAGGVDRLEAIAPPGTGDADVTVTTPGGTSATTPADRFSYLEGPEFGRCVAGSGGEFNNSHCTVASKPKYVWQPGFAGPDQVQERGFSLSGGEAVFETAHKARIACHVGESAGEYTGSRSLSVGRLVLSGCASPTLGACQSAGAAAGEVLSAPLEGTLGVVKEGSSPAKDTLGLELAGAGGAAVAEFSCGGVAATLTGAFTVELAKDNEMSTSFEWKATGKRGTPKPAGLVAEAGATLTLTVGEGPGESAAVALKATALGEEQIEASSVI